MEIDFSDFLNPYDVTFLLVITISFFFGVKNGIVKSFLNLFKWTAIFFIIKNSFSFLRPFIDTYVTNQTLSDILIFLFVLIVSYIFISFINRILISLIQPRKAGLVDFSFGGVLGICRGYIIFVLFIFFINTNFSYISLPGFIKNGTFEDIVKFGVNLLEEIPRELKDINNLDL